MERITKDNKIFKTADYLKDKTRFHIITKNFKSGSLLLYSDQENYVVCRGAVNWPTWIWTKDNFDHNVLPEIEVAMKSLLTAADKDKFTCKKELYDLLVQDGFANLNLDDYFEMGSLCCKKTIIPRKCDGSMEAPTMDDKEVLTQYWFNSCTEMNGVDAIDINKAAKDIEDMLNSNQFFVWRNKDGKIVCMVYYNVSLDEAVLNHVYTPVEERGHGYAANLIYELTNMLLKKGLVPLLYTDYNYPASNKAYINAGYEETGMLINFSCSSVKRER